MLCRPGVWVPDAVARPGGRGGARGAAALQGPGVRVSRGPCPAVCWGQPGLSAALSAALFLILVPIVSGALCVLKVTEAFQGGAWCCCGVRPARSPAVWAPSPRCEPGVLEGLTVTRHCWLVCSEALTLRLTASLGQRRRRSRARGEGTLSVAEVAEVASPAAWPRAPGLGPRGPSSAARAVAAKGGARNAAREEVTGWAFTPGCGQPSRTSGAPWPGPALPLVPPGRGALLHGPGPHRRLWRAARRGPLSFSMPSPFLGRYL